MKKMIATALLALAIAASTFVPAGSSAFAQTNEQPGQLVPNAGTMMEQQSLPGDNSLSNIPSTPDNQSQSDAPSEPSRDCTCAPVQVEMPFA